MLLVGDCQFWTRRLLGQQLAVSGLEAGDVVMVHAGLRSVGATLNGPDTLIDAILDVIGHAGTLLCYVNWDQQYEDALDGKGYLPPELKPEIPSFDLLRSRASRAHGVFAEFVRTIPGALRSGNPGASVVAVGHQATWFVADHPIDYGYGPGSPFAKLVSKRGKVLMIGAPLDTMSLLHHAEHLAQLPGKRIRRMEIPLQLGGLTHWRLLEEFDTIDPVIAGLDGDYFGTVVNEFLQSGQGQRALIGDAPSVLVPAAAIVTFAVEWLEQRFGQATTSPE